MEKETNFSKQQRKFQENWREENISDRSNGYQNGRNDYNHIIPRMLWKETLWENIREKLAKYIEDNNITAHSGTHNLLSSWVACANLYFPVRESQTLKILMLEFLKQRVSDEIIEVVDVELEFGFAEDNLLSPFHLLGEKGSRGQGQTSPDVAFMVEMLQGKGVVLTECKYTEHSFYGCSARRTEVKGDKVGNPDPKRCMNKHQYCDYTVICHQTKWNRKYWDQITLSEYGKKMLKRCPAATAGYQLFRQQALAEAMVQSGEYSMVATTVSYDARNAALKGSLRITGIDDFQDWGNLFEGRALFKVWTHQDWVHFVRNNQQNGEFDGWLEYLKRRYGY